MNDKTAAQLARAAHIQHRLEGASEEDKDTITIILCDIVDALLGESGAGILFVDKAGTGEMSVHVIGDYDLAPEMLLAAPGIYERLFGVPKGAIPQ